MPCSLHVQVHWWKYLCFVQQHMNGSEYAHFSSYSSRCDRVLSSFHLGRWHTCNGIWWASKHGWSRQGFFPSEGSRTQQELPPSPRRFLPVTCIVSVSFVNANVMYVWGSLWHLRHRTCSNAECIQVSSQSVNPSSIDAIWTYSVDLHKPVTSITGLGACMLEHWGFLNLRLKLWHSRVISRTMMRVPSGDGSGYDFMWLRLMGVIHSNRE